MRPLIKLLFYPRLATTINNSEKRGMLSKLVRSEYYNEDYILNEQEYKGRRLPDPRVQLHKDRPLLESQIFALHVQLEPHRRQGDPAAQGGQTAVRQLPLQAAGGRRAKRDLRH